MIVSSAHSRIRLQLLLEIKGLSVFRQAFFMRMFFIRELKSLDK